jgi:transcription-repair coupling factor (superfamily II helicase)
MSLSGLRGLSILGTALPGRLAVKTEVKPYSDPHLRKALLAELKRKGQVYVVHNRVGSLPLVQAKVDDLLRKEGLTASTAMAHGQMDELELATTMSRFLAGEIDVLVASSIVENGLDSPTANTLIVLHSEWFGLSDLYQLRGRVGRRNKQAFAYFFLGGVERTPYLNQAEVPGTIKITNAARKRLIALQEADRLGSGWEIAMRDLEIRGGGNILGHEQHGSMEAIGLLLYAKLLQEEIGRQAKELGIHLFQTKENKNTL